MCLGGYKTGKDKADLDRPGGHVRELPGARRIRNRPLNDLLPLPKLDRHPGNDTSRRVDDSSSDESPLERGSSETPKVEIVRHGQNGKEEQERRSDTHGSFLSERAAGSSSHAPNG